MGNKYNTREVAVTILVVIAFVTAIISGTVIAYPLLSNVFTNDRPNQFAGHSKISIQPPYDFAKADSIVQSSVLWLEQKGLTTGTVDPWLNRYGNLQTRYDSLKALAAKIHELVLAYPDSARANQDTTPAFQEKVKPALNAASSFSSIYIATHRAYGKMRWWTVAFFVSLIGIIRGCIWFKEM